MEAVLVEKELEMDTLETKTLLGYSIDIFEISEFKKYYDYNTDKFTDFARGAFLKAISIPPAYFLEQPKETQEELLCNKLDLVGVQKKYAGLSVVVISKDNQILNATKMKTNEVEMRYEAISSIEDIEGIVWERSLIKDGYICGYLVCGTVSGKAYNRAIFVDLPILFNKPTSIHQGFVKLASPDMPIQKDMIYYTSTEEVDYNDYQHIALAIEDTMNSMQKDLISVDKEEKKEIYREALEVVCRLIELKVMPKSLLNPVFNYINKDLESCSITTLTTQYLLQALILFDNNVKALKQVNALREAKSIIDALHKEEWSNRREVVDSE